MRLAPEVTPTAAHHDAYADSRPRIHIRLRIVSIRLGIPIRGVVGIRRGIVRGISVSVTVGIAVTIGITVAIAVVSRPAKA
jgi:hypothetical protein